jgi:hypothetical protein
MDTESQTLFDELMAKQPHELRATDIEFLKARESYLTGDQRELFGEILGLTKPEPKPKKKAE